MLHKGFTVSVKTGNRKLMEKYEMCPNRALETECDRQHRDTAPSASAVAVGSEVGSSTSTSSNISK